MPAFREPHVQFARSALRTTGATPRRQVIEQTRKVTLVEVQRGCSCLSQKLPKAPR